MYVNITTSIQHCLNTTIQAEQVEKVVEVIAALKCLFQQNFATSSTIFEATNENLGMEEETTLLERIWCPK